jgi:hypothetical protein
MFCSMNSTIILIDVFSAQVDISDITASESTLKETSICTQMVTRSKRTLRSKSPLVVPVSKPCSW